MDRLYTLKEVAALTGFQSETIRLALKDGEIKGLKLRSQWRIPERAVEEWLRSGRVEPVEAPVSSRRIEGKGSPGLSLRERVRTERRDEAA